VTTALIERIRRGVVGADAAISTPYGDMPLVYADYTASGRSLGFIEDYLRDVVMPMYANTHSEASLTGAMTNAYRERARATIKRAVNGGKEDRVVFCGSGATAAVNRLIDVLGWRHGSGESAEARPLVFVGPYEHHSNELPWREAAVDVESIPLNAEGALCLESLEAALKRFNDRPVKLGSFSAASNVTGIRTDVPAVTRLLKAYGALACWDYAAAGPYVGIDVNTDAPIDAVFVSPHKFVGGPGTPGVLIAKAHMFNLDKPAVVGGGTVAWVSPEHHVYVQDVERREEGGTPAILESIRAGLVFELQQEVGTARIEAIEHERTRQALQRLGAELNLEILGPRDAERLSIVSMRFRHGEDFLHYGFVVTLLNDLFGIQVRGGCSCAGPYGHALLGIDATQSAALSEAIAEGWSSLRPGWVRLNFNWFIDDAEFEYLLEALTMVARDGWRLMGDYRLDPNKGVWRHRDAVDVSERMVTLAAFMAEDGMVGNGASQPSTARPAFSAAIARARKILDAAGSGQACTMTTALPERYTDLQWFVTAPESEPAAMAG
jgi:selenocysteine lyase/cysteine desulfurase